VDWTVLPTVNACLNAVVTVLLASGWLFIRRRRWQAHRNCMLAAFGVSVVFLVSYLTYHAQVGSVRFQGEGMVRSIYFGILISHTVLAAAVPFLAIVTLSRGLRRRLEQHVRIARYTLPIWLYVSVTGVVVYLMLYQMDVK
jgi:uncharacterized membrane protein YozB (DUF420 family)